MDIQSFLSGMADVLEMSRDNISEETILIPNRLDSLATLAVISLIDENFGVTVPANELSKCASVGAIVALIRRALAESVAS